MKGRLGVTKDKALEMLRDGWHIESTLNGAFIVRDVSPKFDKTFKHLNTSSFHSLIRNELIRRQSESYPAIWTLAVKATR